MQSLLWQFDREFEVIVVDSYSTDGSREILGSLEKQGRIRLVSSKCSRGRGRQLAFENSNGEYIIDQIDIDDAYKPVLKSVIQFYHARFEGLVMLMHGFLIAPRNVVTEIGGWHDLQWGEDLDFWARAAQVGKFCWVRFETRSDVRPQGSGNLIHGIVYRYEKLRDLYRLGLDPWERIPHSITSRVEYLPLAILGYVRSKTMQSYLNPRLKSFNRSDYGIPSNGLHLEAVPASQ